MIYIFDKKQAIIKVLTNDDFTAAHLNFKINTATTFEFSLPASKALPSGSKYVATPHPLDDSKFIMLRLTERVDNTETIDYSAYELAYQELATDGYIEDKRPQNQSALNLMKIALDGSNWELNNVNVSGTATTNFYYTDHLSAISNVVDLLGGEIVFYIEIQGNAISGRYMDYLARQGADTSKVFASGSNLLTVERQSDTSNIYTAILPRGKGEEIDNGDADTPDGYGRRINISDVEWKKSSGKPLDKPKGSIVLSDPDATAEWGQINGNARLLLQTYDDIDDVNVLINSAYKTLQSVNHPQIQYSATVADVGGLSLGDTVLIMHGDRDLSYKTRVFEVKYDLLSSDQTELSLGDDLSSNSITSQINDLNAVADTTSSQTQWTINQIGRPGTTYGETAPDSPKVGDIWFKYLPDGGTEIYRWNGDIWELLASPTTADDIAAAVDESVAQAKTYTDGVKQGLSTDIDTAKSQAASAADAHINEVKQSISSDIAAAASQAASQASTAEANAKSDATSQFNQAKDALAEAKENLQSDIDESKGNIVEINKTLTGFDGTIQRVQGAINELNQVNQLMNTEFTPDLQGWNDQTLAKTGVGTFNGSNILDLSANSDFRQLFIPLNGATIMSASVYRKISISGGSGCRWSLMFYGSNNTFISSVYGTYQTSLPDFTLEKLESISVPSGAQSVSLRFYSDGTASIHQIVKPMLVFESKVGAYVQGNYNNNDALAKVKLTADQVSLDLSTYTEDADGRIHKAQSDIEANATEITKKVSQTDYDKKTGELSSKLNTTTDTADGTKQALSDYKEYANGNISGLSSDLNKLAGEVGLKLSKTDYDNSQSELNTSLSQWKADYDGWTGTVSKLSTKVNNLGQVNQLINTEFTPDLQGWSEKTLAKTGVGTFNGSNILDLSANHDFRQLFVPLNGATIISASVYRKISITGGSGGRWSLMFYGANNAFISSVYGTYQTSLPDFTLEKLENISVPNGAQSVSLRFYLDGTASIHQIVKPMLVFESTVGTYVQGNYNNNAALAQVKITADSISNFVRDSSGNISSDFQTALSKTSIITDSTLATSIQIQTSSQITQALTDNNKNIISFINLDTSGAQIAGKNITLDSNAAFSDIQKTVNGLGQINQLFNTEFSPDFQGWTQVSTAYRTTGNTRNGSNVVKVVGDDGDYLYQDIPVSSGVVSFSSIMQLDDGFSGSFRFAINFRDSNYAYVSAGGTTWGTNNTTAMGYKLQKVENISVPAGASYVRINYQFRGTGVGRIIQPMLVFSPTVGTYVQGNYNNNAALAQVKITADSIYNFVRDSSGNISSDFQTALSKTSIITGSTLATSIQTQTSSQITQVLTDNNKNIIAMINLDTSGVQIAGKQLILDGPTTVTSDFYAKGGNFKNLNASNMTVGTLNGNQVNITNINANNIVTGNLTGITLMSSANGSQFKVQGDNLQMIKQNGDNLQLSTDGLFWKDSSGNVLFEASNKITTSDIFGTAEYNVYLASLNETRSVTYATALTGSGGVSDYNYVPHRAGGIYTTWVEVNASGGAENVYIRPLTAQSEARITASGGTDSYANLRARYIYANRIGINSRTDAQQLYLQTGDEVRVKSTNDDVENSAYKAIRASAFNSASLAEYKQNIDVSSISGLDEINKSTIYNYQLKTSPDKQEVGLVIGDGYDISQIVIDGDGVNQYRMVALAWKAIQELTQRINTLEQSLESEGK